MTIHQQATERARTLHASGMSYREARELAYQQLEHPRYKCPRCGGSNAYGGNPYPCSTCGFDGRAQRGTAPR